MLNMKAMPAAGGAGLAAYLWKEAVGVDAPETLELTFEDAVYQEYAKRLERVQAAGVEDIDHDLLWDKASDDVVAAILRDDAKHVPGVAYRGDMSPELAEILKIDLTAPPELQNLKNLLSGGSADGQPIKGRRYRTDHKKQQLTMGSLELVFSADKSVSVYAQGENRPAIARAQSRAVDVAMHQIADQIGVIRSRRGGLDRRDPADVTWVQWQHRFSRLGQPQIHTHVSLINVCRSRVDGKVGTLDTFLLHGFYPTVRETYHRALADELRKLGLPVVFDTKVPAAVLTNVPYEDQRQASSRTVIAEKAAAEYVESKLAVHFSSLTPKQKSAWIGRAAWRTRPRTKREAEASQSRNEPDRTIRLRLDSRYNRGGGRYDDDLGQRHGRSL